jgi:hypothetical protein
MADCEPPGTDVPDPEIAGILKKAKTIAVVGVSRKEDRASHKVAKYLMEQGYRVIPVNPAYPEALGERCYPNVASVPEHIDIVDIFRSEEAIPEIVEEAIGAGAGCVWMQLGLAHREAAAKACGAGLAVVMDKCVKQEHSRLMR